MNKCLGKEDISCLFTEPVRHGDEFCTGETMVFLSCCPTCVHTVSFFKTSDVFPMAASCGRLAHRGHVSTTMLQLTQGEGKGGGGVRGLFYLISVSTRASVWCKRVGVFFSFPIHHFTSFPPLSHSGLWVPCSPHHPVNPPRWKSGYIFPLNETESVTLGSLWFIQCLVCQHWLPCD